MATKDILYSVSNIYVNGYPSGFVMDIDGTNNPPTGITHKVLIKRDSTTLVTITMPDPFAIGMQRRGINLTSEQITAIQNGMPDVASFTATIVLQTFNNGTQVGDDSISSAVISVTSMSAPTLADYTYADAANRTGNPNRLLNGLSELTFYNVSATAKAGASIVRYEISTSTGETKSFSSGGTLLWSNWGTSPFDSSANVVFTITVYDSRGLSASRSKTIYVEAYTIATLTSYSVKRNLIDPTSIDISFTGTYTNTGSNLPEIDYKYRVYGSGSYSTTYTIMDQEMTIEGNQFSFSGTFGTSSPTMASDKTYEFVLIAYDIYTEGVAEYNQYYYITIPTTQMHLSFRENALGIGGVPTGTKTVEVASEWSLVANGKNNQFNYMPYSFVAYGTEGSNGFARIATINITGNGLSSPFKFEIVRRIDGVSVTLYLLFNNESNTDPALKSFYYDSYAGTVANYNPDAFAYKSAASTWDIYVRKSAMNDFITVITTVPNYNQSRCNITYTQNLLSSVPSGAITAKGSPRDYWQVGDTYSARYEILSGLITNSLKGIRFSWKSPKRLDNITTITVTAMTGTIRSTSGYLDSDSSNRDWTTVASIYAPKLNQYVVNLELDFTTARTNATNNTPVTFYANTSFVLTFS